MGRLLLNRVCLRRGAIFSSGSTPAQITPLPTLQNWRSFSYAIRGPQLTNHEGSSPESILQLIPDLCISQGRSGGTIFPHQYSGEPCGCPTLGSIGGGMLKHARTKVEVWCTRWGLIGCVILTPPVCCMASSSQGVDKNQVVMQTPSHCPASNIQPNITMLLPSTMELPGHHSYPATTTPFA